MSYNLFTKFGNPSTNAVVSQEGDLKVFRHYGTPVAAKDSMGRIILFPAWDYSTTTAQYRNQFTGLDLTQTRKGIKNGTITLADAPNAL